MADLKQMQSRIGELADKLMPEVLALLEDGDGEATFKALIRGGDVDRA